MVTTRKSTKRRRQPKGSGTIPVATPVAVIKPDPVAWDQALALSGGDTALLVTNHDGSVTVCNTPDQRRKFIRMNIQRREASQ